MGGLLDHTERLLRAEIASWPDGVAEFTDFIGSDGIDVCDVPITVRLTVQGDELTADFSRVGADGARLAQLHAVVRRGGRLPRGDGCVVDRHPAAPAARCGRSRS